jgi:hypothetical protein
VTQSQAGALHHLAQSSGSSPVALATLTPTRGTFAEAIS